MAASDAAPGARERGPKVAGDRASETRTRAWDAPTRVFKWTLVVLVVTAFATRYLLRDTDPGLVWHQRNGLAILILLVFRVLWGLVGGTTSRFVTWVRWPWTAVRYGVDLARGRRRHYLGHNPLGGWVILAMLALVATQAISGLMTSDDILAEGPLVAAVSAAAVRSASALHANLFWVLLAVIAAHLAANFFYQFILGDNLIGSMVTGWKPRERYEDVQRSADGPWLRALVCLAVAAAIVFGTVAVLGGNPFPR